MDTIQISRVVKQHIKTDLPQLNVGDTVKVFSKVKETKGIRSQAFEGIVIEHRHGGIDTTIVVRKLADAGIFVEKIFAIHSPIIDKIEIVKKGDVRRAKLRYLRNRVGKQALFVKPLKETKAKQK